MIKIEAFSNRISTEKRINEMEEQGFKFKTLAFRGNEAWVVFEKQAEQTPAILHTGESIVPVATAKKFETAIANSVKAPKLK